MSFRRISKKIRSRTCLVICIPLALSCFTHFWNPIGFPPIYIDEGHYMRRTMQVLGGLGPQEPIAVYEFAFDHPYFGQIFLAGILSAVDYPHSLNPSLDNAERSVKSLYEIPRLIMGMLAVIDTFFIFKIFERRYGRQIGFISSTLFAVMPVTWFLSMILLDNIMLPFLLSSVLAISYTTQRNSVHDKIGLYASKRYFYIALSSGVLFGLAIFTKESAVTFIPLLIYLVFASKDRHTYSRLKFVMIWLIPVIIFSIIWPLYSAGTGQFDNWLHGVLYQVEREERGLDSPLLAFFEIDPLFSILGILATIFAIFKVAVLKNRDLFFFFWSVPYFLFLFLIGGAVKYFHLILIVPVLCVEIALFIVFISKIISRMKLSINPLVIFTGIAVFGFVSTVIMVSNDLTSTYFEMYSSILHTLPDSRDDNHTVTMIGKHWARSFFWIPKYIFNQDVGFKVIDPVLFPNYTNKSGRVLLLLDKTLISQIKDNIKQEDYIRQLGVLYHNTTKKDSITENWTKAFYPSYYPYSSLDSILGRIGRLDIRTNY